MPVKKIRLLVADDHEIVRMGLSALFDAAPDIEVVGEAQDGEEAVRMTERLKPDVVVLDLMMPVKDGVAATAEIVRLVPTTRVLILTTSGDAEMIGRALDAGARGVALKSASNARLAPAVRALASGEISISSEAQEILSTRSELPRLTNRQIEILNAVVRGLTNREIGDVLGISLNSVKWHLKDIFARLGAANRSEAVAIALREGLVEKV